MAGAVTVWAVVAAGECSQCQLNAGDDVVQALYATEQTARQHADRDGYQVQKMQLLSKLRGY